MSHWIKIGSCLYNLDRAQHINLGAILKMASDLTIGGVQILFADGKAAEFTGPEADAVRMYLAAKVLEQTIEDLSVLTEPEPTVGSGKDGGE